MTSRTVVLKSGKEKAIRNHHHWIFSGAIATAPKYEDGEILGVESAKGELLGCAYFNSKCSIVGRMLSFGEEKPKAAVVEAIKSAIAMRRSLFDPAQTTAYRLIHGESDRLPGLTVDRYGDVLVLQIATLGMEKLKSLVVETLVSELSQKAIYEKSNLPSRKEEGLSDHEELLFGEVIPEVIVLENGLKLVIEFDSAQKTGFFLDQREMRAQIRALSSGKKVLDCFSYAGGFGVSALAGGAKSVDIVDISEKATVRAKRNVEENGFEKSEVQFLTEDAFAFLHQKPLDYDLVILDPPAFAKRKSDVVAACRGYKDINRITMRKMPKGSLLLSCSCSYHVDEKLFQQVLFQAAAEAGRFIRIIGKHRLAADHPVSLFHPEGEYLKGFLLFIE